MNGENRDLKSHQQPLMKTSKNQRTGTRKNELKNEQKKAQRKECAERVLSFDTILGTDSE